jgi:uncharacterized repeat protein (TIGR04138 family)
MPPVSMRMAKIQKTTLDPAKISGRCGRLKCCLRYEFETYQALERELPPVGSKVITARGPGRVLALEILAQKVVVEFEDRRKIVLGPDETMTTSSRNDDRRCDEPPVPRTRFSPSSRSAPPMSLRDALGNVAARDPRYSWEAYIFVFEAIEHARHQLPRLRSHTGTSRDDPHDYHVTGRELCEAARDLALRQFGMLALTVLKQWGIRSTSDLGELVYHLIATGDLERTASDKRSDFDNVFDFETAFQPDYELTGDPAA